MANLEYKQFYQRHRPHIQPPGRVLFITYRLAGSIPKSVVLEYKRQRVWVENQLVRALNVGREEEIPESTAYIQRVSDFQRQWFLKFEEILHKAKTGPMWMSNSRVAEKVTESLSELDGKSLRLDAYCVMSNHVHAVFKPFVSEENLIETTDISGHPLFVSDYPGLARIMRLVKGRSARECNRILLRSGQFWEHESFDHVVRSGKFFATIRYVINNPVKAGLAKHWRDWAWTYCRKEISDKLDPT